MLKPNILHLVRDKWGQCRNPYQELVTMLLGTTIINCAILQDVNTISKAKRPK